MKTLLECVDLGNAYSILDQHQISVPIWVQL